MNLKDWRKQNGLSMERAAEILDLSQSTISRIEAGKQWPDKATVLKIVELTDGLVTANDFVNPAPTAETAAQSEAAAE